jgi:hypothetical protein
MFRDSEYLTGKSLVDIFISIHILNSYPGNVDKMVGSYNASKWRMGFNSAFKGLTAIIDATGELHFLLLNAVILRPQG